MTSWPDEWLIEHRKISDYLLNIAHPDGRAKARALLGAGFSAAQPEVLAIALLDHVKTARHRQIEGRSGLRFVFEGPLVARLSIMPRFRSVWLKSGDERVGRLVTAYPYDDRGIS